MNLDYSPYSLRKSSRQKVFKEFKVKSILPKFGYTIPEFFIGIGIGIAKGIGTNLPTNYLFLTHIIIADCLATHTDLYSNLVGASSTTRNSLSGLSIRDLSVKG